MKNILININKVLFSCILLINSSMACKTNRIEDLSKIKNKAIYIEEHTKGDGLQSGSFGDLILLDLDTKKKYKLTDDDFYDESSCFSPDGKQVLFQSNRSGSNLDRMISGISGPHSTCILDLSTGKIAKIDFNYEKNLPERMRTDFDFVQWSMDHKHLYFMAFPLNIVRSTVKGDSLKFIKDFSKDEKARFTDMYDMKLSFDDKYIAFMYIDFHEDEKHNLEDRENGLGIYNLDNSQLKLVDILTIGSVYCWTRDSKKVLYLESGKMFSYDVTENRSELLWDTEKDNIYVKKCVKLNSNKLLLIACKYEVKMVQGEKKEIYGSTELAQYDLSSHRFEWITNDGLEKDYLDSFVDSNSKPK